MKGLHYSDYPNPFQGLKNTHINIDNKPSLDRRVNIDEDFVKH